jgi:hypothetical protein
VREILGAELERLADEIVRQRKSAFRRMTRNVIKKLRESDAYERVMRDDTKDGHGGTSPAR